MAKRNDIYNLFDELKNKGRYGDTELAHITPNEASLLESLGGAGTINPETGLREYHGSLFGPPFGEKPKGHPAHHWTLTDNPLIDLSKDIGGTLGLGEDDDYGMEEWEEKWRDPTQRDIDEAQEGSGTISYDDYKQFLDPTTGKISDTEGMRKFLQSNKQIRDLGYTSKNDIIELMKNMPALGLDPYDLKTGQATHQAGLEGMSQDIQAQSKKKSSQRISSGVTSPVSDDDSLGYLSLEELNPYMQKGTQFAQEKGNIYGLGQESSDELVSWISNLPKQGS